MKKTNAIRILEQAKVDFQLIEYQYDPENLDVAKIAMDNELELAIIYKTLIAKGDKTGPLVAVVPGDQSLSLKKLAGLSGNKKIALLPIKDLQKTTGYVRGGCSPIGLRKTLPVYIDQRALALEQIFVNAGTRGLLFGCTPNTLINLSQATTADICQ
jgi:Cys-tRNA(Pro)/Cys-tRNA(Cys) deacylase